MKQSVKRISLLIATILSGSLAHATNMLPMPQTFLTKTNGVLPDSFHVESPKASILATNTQSAKLTITLPNGDAMATGNAAILPVTEQPGLQFFPFAGVPGEVIEAHEYFAVAMALGTDGGAALAATVSADLIDSAGNVVSTVTLNDEGVSPDKEADDGIYTSVASISQAGDYLARFRVSWNGHQGVVYQPLVIASTGLGLTGNFTTSAIDSNNNGLIEAVELTFEESGVREAGAYNLNVTITDSDGGRISSGGLFSGPSASLSAIFGIEDLNKLGARPWIVSKASMMRDFDLLGSLHDIGTLDIDPDTFERPPMVIHGISGNEGIDDDGDGLYERLNVNIEVITQAAGDYAVSSDLRSSNQGRVSDDSIPNLHLTKGRNTITLSFLGGDIGRAGANGPYQVSNFLIYPNFDSQMTLAKWTELVGDTSNYTCNQFPGCDSDRESEIQRIAGIMCRTSADQIKARLNQIKALENQQPEVAERQLQALYNEAVILEKSGACLPSKGMSGDRAQFQETKPSTASEPKPYQRIGNEHGL
ncbi:choice-of-anchor X domain-containing protein [Marinobacter xestospongiae]|uniref:Choice-of-anchor X domain-containing protein n=1 Tax=Marinobacter xestospongiae TaxID=994319 RepID=A0ABU3W3S3_9GAMM|nr:choice-of-anchor X domain-containing protein [Marinobacter xestospongiae]MDV2081191.1 choice-of-anchor X domain-containing protein [Marinobacter xestospongiae]